LARFQALNEKIKIVARFPAKLIAGFFVDVHAVDAGKHFPATSFVFRLKARIMPSHHARNIHPQISQFVKQEGRGRTYDISVSAAPNARAASEYTDFAPKFDPQ
jgi:hypothetical protein